MSLAAATDSARSSLALPLRTDTLAHHARRVKIPGYDRARLRPGVVHMSVGSFHRSHQAVYFDDLAELGARDWGIVGVGLRRPLMRAALAAQDGLYTVVARGPERAHARIVGALTRYLLAPQETDAVLATLADERTKAVTLTITADAYQRDPSTARETGEPCSALAFLVEALARRRDAAREPFTVLSCDNVPSNGRVARDAVTAFARSRDEGLARWIEESVAFPSSMVDRITPNTTEADRRFVAGEFGVSDRWPVITEPYSEWVLEDDFCNSRPPLDAVGVRFVADVAPFALRKTRLLNASHCAIGYLGALAGLRRTDDVLRDPVFEAYVTGLMDDEVTPLLPAIHGTDLRRYKRTLLERLANPKIGDELGRLCRNGSAKVPAHVLPSIVQARERGSDHQLLTLAVAAWFRYLRGYDEAGQPVAIDDPRAARLRALARSGGPDPRPLLGERSVFGDLVDDHGFVSSLERALASLDRRGARAAVRACLAAEVRVAA